MASQIAPTKRKTTLSLFRTEVGSLLTLVALGASLTACAQTGTVKDLTVRDWVGSTEPALLASWGQPHHSYPMAAGGKMIGYQFTDHPVAWTPRGQMHTRVRNCMVNFETNAAGIILDATATGSSCTIGPHSQMHPAKS